MRASNARGLRSRSPGIGVDAGSDRVGGRKYESVEVHGHEEGTVWQATVEEGQLGSGGHAIIRDSAGAARQSDDVNFVNDVW